MTLSNVFPKVTFRITSEATITTTYLVLIMIVFFEHALCSVWDPLKNSLRNVKLESRKTYESVRQGEKGDTDRLMGRNQLE